MISVIIVNYGTADLTIEAVESVLSRTHGGREVEVHVVDNASPGGDAEHLADAHTARDWGDRVTLWPETENHGFGRGNNVVLNALDRRATPPEFVFLLNPDAKLENEALMILSEALEANATAAAAGAAIMGEGGEAVTSAFRFPSLTSTLLETGSFGPLDRIFSKYLVPLAPDHPAGPVDWVSGAAVMFRFSALKETGFFDPAFFLYFEETELQNRLGRAGWTTLFVPTARIRHAEGAATGQFGANRQRQRRPEYLYRSRWIYFTKTKGRAQALGIALLVLPAALLNVLQRRLRGRAPTLPLNFFRDHCRYGLWPLLRPGGLP